MSTILLNRACECWAVFYTGLPELEFVGKYREALIRSAEAQASVQEIKREVLRLGQANTVDGISKGVVSGFDGEFADDLMQSRS